MVKAPSVLCLGCFIGQMRLHICTKHYFQMLYLQLIARTKGESWSKPAQSGLLIRASDRDSNLQAREKEEGSCPHLLVIRGPHYSHRPEH